MLLHPSYIKSCLKGITGKEVRLHLFFVPISNHKWWADVRKLSSRAPSLEIMRMALLMVGHLLFFSGPLGTRQWNCAKLGKLLPAWFMAIASSLFPHFHKHQILLENLGGNLPILGYFGFFFHHLLTFDLTSQITKWKMGSVVLPMITNHAGSRRKGK